MADLTLTAASVVAGSGSSTQAGTAGETITAGQLVYLKTSDSKYWRANTETSAATATVAGIALNGASADQPLDILTGGNITIGATVGVGTVYILSTAGLICPVADLATNDYVSVLGIATTAAIINVKINNSGIQKAA